MALPADRLSMSPPRPPASAVGGTVDWMKLQPGATCAGLLAAQCAPFDC